MSPEGKVGIVVAGYVAALVAGGVAGHVYNVWMAAQPYDTSGGMYAGGELLTVLAVFWTVAFVLFACLAPSGFPRRTLIAAVGVELVNATCAAVHWVTAR